MAASNVITSIKLTSLPKVSEGKVRDLYNIDDKTLLFVTSDRVSAYDVIMKNGIPDKGALLTQLSKWWFQILPDLVPGLKTHFLTTDEPVGLSPEESLVVKNRSMQVRKLKVFPIEAIVRGYLTGSAYKEYLASGTIHGIELPVGLKECQAIPGGPVFTPSTKAPLGEHDENIHPDKTKDIVGEKYAKPLADLSVKVFKAAQDYAKSKGIIIADTKFEWALDEETDEIVLVDEVLTSDSSRMWDEKKYEIGHDQESFDKQILRNWLTKEGLKAKEDVELPEDVAKATSDRYKEVFHRLTGKTLEDALKT